MKTLNSLLLFLFCMGVATVSMAQAGGASCASATAVTPSTGIVASGPGTVGGTISNVCFTSGGSASEWYSFTPASNGTLDVASCNGGTDTRLSVYSGSCAGLTCLGSNDDDCPMGPGASSFASQVTGVPVTAGTTYYIEWDDRWSGNGFTWDLNFTAAPSCVNNVANVLATSTGNDVTITWNSTTGAASPIVYGPTGFTDPAQAIINFGSSGVTFSGVPPGGYDFYVADTCNGQLVLVGPSTVCVGSFVGVVSQAPFSESFEDCGGGLSDFWTQSTADQRDWTPNTGGTSSGGTGPSGPSNGSQYIYLETSSPAVAGDSAVIESEQVDITTVSAAVLRFDYHMFGATTGTLRAQINDGTGWTTVWSLSGNQGDQWFTAEVGLSGFSSPVRVRFIAIRGTSFTGDIGLDNVRFEDICVPTVSAPYFESFEGADPSVGVVCMTQSTNDILDWLFRTGPTPSSGTGPTAAFDSSYYAYIEASSPAQTNDSAIISTPTIDISGLQYPELKFAYHMFGGSVGILRVDMSNDLGTTWQPIWIDSLNKGNQWLVANLNLELLGAGPFVQFRFLASPGFNAGFNPPQFSSDIAIDAISVANGIATDLQTVEVFTSYPSCASSGIPVAFEVANTGFTPVFDFTYGVEINNTLLTQFYTDTINPGESVILTLNNGIDLQPGTNVLSYGFIGSDFGDLESSNDFIDQTVLVAGTADGTAYATSWEATADNWYTTEAVWELGAPAGAVINSASEGTDAWVTILAGNYPSISGETYLYSPCFDFSGYAADPDVNFDIWYEIETDWDGAWLEVTTDGGATWSKVGALGTGTNWYNANITNNPIGDVWSGDAGAGSNGWLSASNQAVGTAGLSSVQFRFVFYADGFVEADGFGVDNFSITPFCPADLGLNLTVFPSGAVVVPTLGAAPYSYAWSNGSTSSVVDSIDVSGDYTVVVTDANGCTDSATVSILAVGTNGIVGLNELSLFPNPVTDLAQLILSFENPTDIRIEVINIEGRVLSREIANNVATETFQINVSNYPEGVYMVRIIANDQATTKRLVVIRP